MKILYAIQGTGNGHISRAREIIPFLQKKATVDILISGCQAEVYLPYPVTYRFHGLSFIFGKNGAVDLFSTYKNSNLKKLYKEIKSLPIEDYDLVISDFEPVSAWACRIMDKPCIGLSHQAAVINKKSPRPKMKDLVGQTILKNYAPVTKAYGFHFNMYDNNIFTPVIRSEIRNSPSKNEEYYTVYLPAYSNEKIIKILSKVDAVKWQVFSKHTKKEIIKNGIHIRPINNEEFIESLLNCKGCLCGAGFETPAEVLFLEKKLMVIPMKGQYEQQCNAAALKKLGVPVLKRLQLKQIEKIKEWITLDQSIPVNYPDTTELIIDLLLKEYEDLEPINEVKLGEAIYSFKKLKEKTFGKILKKLAKK